VRLREHPIVTAGLKEAIDAIAASSRGGERVARRACVRLPVVKRLLHGEHLGEDEVLPDITKVPEVSVRHAGVCTTSPASATVPE